jgi:hypothetical protein
MKTCFLTKLVAFAIALSAISPVYSATARRTSNCQMKICFRTPQYFLTNFQRLRFFPRDILINGVNFNHPVEVNTNPRQIVFALRGNAYGSSLSPLLQFNQQYVATQLGLALRPLVTVYSSSETSLSCYGLNFDPVTLNNGVNVSPDSTSGALFTQCDIVAIAPTSAARDADMAALARILTLLNNTCY